MFKRIGMCFIIAYHAQFVFVFTGNINGPVLIQIFQVDGRQLAAAKIYKELLYHKTILFMRPVCVYQHIIFKGKVHPGFHVFFKIWHHGAAIYSDFFPSGKAFSRYAFCAKIQDIKISIFHHGALLGQAIFINYVCFAGLCKIFVWLPGEKPSVSFVILVVHHVGHKAVFVCAGN